MADNNGAPGDSASGNDAADDKDSDNKNVDEENKEASATTEDEENKLADENDGKDPWLSEMYMDAALSIANEPPRFFERMNICAYLGKTETMETRTFFGGKVYFDTTKYPAPDQAKEVDTTTYTKRGLSGMAPPAGDASYDALKKAMVEEGQRNGYFLCSSGRGKLHCLCYRVHIDKVPPSQRVRASTSVRPPPKAETCCFAFQVACDQHGYFIRVGTGCGMHKTHGRETKKVKRQQFKPAEGVRERKRRRKVDPTNAKKSKKKKGKGDGEEEDWPENDNDADNYFDSLQPEPPPPPPLPPKTVREELAPRLERLLELYELPGMSRDTGVAIEPLMEMMDDFLTKMQAKVNGEGAAEADGEDKEAQEAPVPPPAEAAPTEIQHNKGDAEPTTTRQKHPLLIAAITNPQLAEIQAESQSLLQRRQQLMRRLPTQNRDQQQLQQLQQLQLEEPQQPPAPKPRQRVAPSIKPTLPPPAPKPRQRVAPSIKPIFQQLEELEHQQQANQFLPEEITPNYFNLHETDLPTTAATQQQTTQLLPFQQQLTRHEIPQLPPAEPAPRPFQLSDLDQAPHTIDVEPLHRQLQQQQSRLFISEQEHPQNRTNSIPQQPLQPLPPLAPLQPLRTSQLDTQQLLQQYNDQQLLQQFNDQQLLQQLNEQQLLQQYSAQATPQPQSLWLSSKTNTTQPMFGSTTTQCDNILDRFLPFNSF